jgi:hypothetical protein
MTGLKTCWKSCTEERGRGASLGNSRILRVDSIELASRMNVINVQSVLRLHDLSDEKDLIYETDQEFLLIKGSRAYRALKEGALPEVLKCLSLTENPDSVRFSVVLEPKELLKWALVSGVTVFETREFYIISGPEVCLKARKECGSDAKRS